MNFMVHYFVPKTWNKKWVWRSNKYVQNYLNSGVFTEVRYGQLSSWIGANALKIVITSYILNRIMKLNKMCVNRYRQCPSRNESDTHIILKNQDLAKHRNGYVRMQPKWQGSGVPWPYTTRLDLMFLIFNSFVSN